MQYSLGYSEDLVSIVGVSGEIGDLAMSFVPPVSQYSILTSSLITALEETSDVAPLFDLLMQVTVTSFVGDIPALKDVSRLAQLQGIRNGEKHLCGGICSTR